MRCPEFLAAHLIQFDNPYLYILHGRVRVAEFFIRILFHNDIQRFRFFIEIFFKTNFTPADHALGTHPVAASHFGMLEDQVMIGTERNAYARIPLQDRDTPPFLCRMQVYNTIAIAEVHWQYIRRSIRICQPYIANISFLNDRFDQLFVSMY